LKEWWGLFAEDYPPAGNGIKPSVANKIGVVPFVVDVGIGIEIVRDRVGVVRSVAMDDDWTPVDAAVARAEQEYELQTIEEDGPFHEPHGSASQCSLRFQSPGSLLFS
jgi:hypothetical protein